jgi:hypothetical protein
MDNIRVEINVRTNNRCREAELRDGDGREHNLSEAENALNTLKDLREVIYDTYGL